MLRARALSAAADVATGYHRDISVQRSPERWQQSQSSLNANSEEPPGTTPVTSPNPTSFVKLNGESLDDAIIGFVRVVFSLFPVTRLVPRIWLSLVTGIFLGGLGASFTRACQVERVAAGQGRSDETASANLCCGPFPSASAFRRV